MLITLFRFEWKLIIRSKSRLLAWLIFCLIGFYSYEEGNSLYRFNAVASDSALAKQSRGLLLIAQTLDTLSFSGIERNSMEDPFFIDWRSQAIAVKKQHPLSILSIGQSDIYLPSRSARFTVPVFNNNFAEFKNPEQLLTGAIDSSFFIIFLIPLLFIALSYNLYAADLEAGIYPLIRMQAPNENSVLIYRLLFRWLFSLSPVLLLFLYSGIMLNRKEGFSLAGFLQWWSIALLYWTGWLAIVYFVLQRRLSSLITAISLSGTWVVLLIIIPGLVNTWLDYRYPVSSKSEIASFRDEDFKGWQLPLSEQKKIVFGQYPAWAKDSARLDTNQLRSFGWELGLIAKERELYQRISDSSLARSKAENRSFWFNPGGAVMRCFSLLSHTSWSYQQKFDTEVIQYREEKMRYLFANAITEPHFTPAHFKAMPRFQSSYPAKTDSLPVLPLALMLLIPGVLSLVNKVKND